MEITRAKTRVEAKIGLESRLEELEIIEFGILGTLLPGAVVSLKAESLSGLLGAMEPHKGFF